jgi:hypothetical protein
MWTKIKTWIKTKLWPWLLCYGWQYLNVLVLIAIYAVNKGNIVVEVLAGTWIFMLIALNGWKWFTHKKCGCPEKDKNK